MRKYLSIKRGLVIAFVLVVVGGLVGMKMFNNTRKVQESQTDQLIIKFKPGYSYDMDKLSAEVGVKLTYFRQMSGGSHVLKIPKKMASSDVEKIVEKLKKSEGVESVEEDLIVTTN